MCVYVCGKGVGGWACGRELVRAKKWLWLALVQSGEEKGKTEARSVLSGQRGT